MNQIGKEEKAWSVLLRLVVICVIALGVNFMISCEPVPCEDCYTYTYQTALQSGCIDY